MAASIDDILSALKNVVVALNTNTQNYLNINGSASSAGITGAKVVKPSPGRVCTVSVVVAGAATGAIYDATSAAATTNPVFTIPMTAGTFFVSIPTSYGIVVAPGSGQTVTVAYS